MLRIAVLLLVAAACTRGDDTHFGSLQPPQVPPPAAPQAQPPEPSTAPLSEQLAIPTKPAKPAKKAKAKPKHASGGGRSTPAPPPPPEPEDEGPKRGLTNGASCTYSSDCASDHCTFGKCESGESDKKLGTGVECTYSSDCASGHCTFNKCTDD